MVLGPFLWVFKVPGCFFMVPGRFYGFLSVSWPDDLVYGRFPKGTIVIMMMMIRMMVMRMTYINDDDGGEEDGDDDDDVKVQTSPKVWCNERFLSQEDV